MEVEYVDDVPSSVMRDLAKDMLRIYKDQYGLPMEGRTVNGIAWEIKGHHDLNGPVKSVLKKKNAEVADMGTTKNDGNALFFELTQWLLGTSH